MLYRSKTPPLPTHTRMEAFPRGDTQDAACYRSKTPYLKAGGIFQRDLILITVNTDVG